MTAFASRQGGRDETSWMWEMRGVNARGLDLRLRLPEGIDGLEPAVRAALGARFARGNISLTLRISRDEAGQGAVLDEVQLDRVLTAIEAVRDRAAQRGLALPPPSPAEVLSLRGVMVQPVPDDAAAGALRAELLADLEPLLDDFAAMRRSEGAALRQILSGQLDRIATLTEAAEAAARARAADVRAALDAALRRVLETAPDMEEGRIAQELALIAVKSDVTEEIDRLRAHVAAARALIDGTEPAGRRLDFLAQEFNREANTLCSKAQAPGLTAIGLDLKAVIDQMREQIQNVE